MTDATVPEARRPDSGAQTAAGLRAPSGLSAGRADGRRRLQLALAALWLLDGILQFQPYMFTKDFGAQTLAAASDGDPGWLAHSITWAAGIVQNHPVGTNTAFALIQVALGLGIAWRPTLKAALLASVGWSVAVWWFGEGLGGLFSGGGDPLTGAPGGVILYALLAVLLWPAERAGPFPAAHQIGARAARVVWLVLWGGLAFLAVLPANTAAGTLGDAITNTDMGAPGWLVALDNHAASLTDGRDFGLSVALAVVFALVAVSVWLPEQRVVRGGLIAAAVVSLLIWVFGEGFGMPYMGMATDPNTGPLLILIAAAYWPYHHSPVSYAKGSTGAGGRALPQAQVGAAPQESAITSAATPKTTTPEPVNATELTRTGGTA